MVVPTVGLSLRTSGSFAARRSEVDGTLHLLKVCVEETGRVWETKVMGPASADIDRAHHMATRQWQFRAMEVNGQVHPFCFPLRIYVRDGQVFE